MKNNLFEYFIRFESSNNLFDIEIETFKIWELLRTYIYIDIENIYNKLQPLFPQTNYHKIKKTSIKILLKSIRIFFCKQKDYIFLNNPRRVKQDDGKYYCIYTDLMIDLLNKNGNQKCVTFEDPFWALSPTTDMSHFEPIKTEDICYLDLMEYVFKIKRFFLKAFNKKRYNNIHSIIFDIEKTIEKEFECDLSSIFKIAEDKILYMILTKKIYSKVIRRIKPKAIFEFYDVFPSKIVINKIAKEEKIPIIEIQHGIVTEKNPIFLKYYDVNRKYDCLPNYVLSYGKKLLNTTYMPIEKEKIYYIGSLFLEKKKKEYKKQALNKKNILFVSQSNLGIYISEYASQLANLLKENPEYQIIYKMHPYEIGTDYECLKKPNITVINNRDKDLYYFQSISIAQVGVYSTGLYEGLAFGLNTFILDNNYGTNEIKGMLKKTKGIEYVNNVDDLLKSIKKINKENALIDNYWQKVDEKRITQIISSIIS